MFYIGIGYEICSNKLLDKTKGVLDIAFVMGLLGVTYLFVLLAGKCNFSRVSYGNNPCYILAGAVCGAVGRILIGYQDKRPTRFLKYCGENSLILLITHSPFKFTNISQKIVSFCVSPQTQFWGLICLVPMIIVELCVVYIFNNYLKFLIESIEKQTI